MLSLKVLDGLEFMEFPGFKESKMRGAMPPVKTRCSILRIFRTTIPQRNMKPQRARKQVMPNSRRSTRSTWPTVKEMGEEEMVLRSCCETFPIECRLNRTSSIFSRTHAI